MRPFAVVGVDGGQKNLVVHRRRGQQPEQRLAAPRPVESAAHRVVIPGAQGRRFDGQALAVLTFAECPGGRLAPPPRSQHRLVEKDHANADEQVDGRADLLLDCGHGEGPRGRPKE